MRKITHCIIFIGLCIVFVTKISAAQEQYAKISDISLRRLLEINSNFSYLHEGFPLGVPRSYDWARGPRMGAGNDPGPNLAVIGWGQVFWSESASEGPIFIKIKNFRTFLCEGQRREWVLLSDGDIEGRQFRPDYLNNLNEPLPYFQQNSDQTTIAVKYGSAFHFWPKSGRTLLVNREICGVLVLLQAKATVGINETPYENSSDKLLIGLGADYWRNVSAKWDNYKTNRDIGIGRLEFVESNWKWYGMSTASDEDLKRFYQGGFKRRVVR